MNQPSSEDQPLGREVLSIDCKQVEGSICDQLRHSVLKRFRRRGAVIGLSGGIDSSVVAALCAHALGPDRVLGLLMPEGESAESEESTRLGMLLAESLGIATAIEDISPVLEAAGCYTRRDEALRRVIPEYGQGWRSKIVLPSVVDSEQYRIFSVVARSPEGVEIRRRLTPEAYLGVVAAVNFKQRTRKMFEYFHSDRRSYCVMGTPNRLEYDQGFFVKGGDGLADVKPIAHLYKSQVYQLAGHLGVPDEICERAPTTDTYSLPQSQEEFYFSLPYRDMDLCLWARDKGISPARVARTLDLSEEQMKRVYRDIESKRRMSGYLHAPALLMEERGEAPPAES